MQLPASDERAVKLAAAIREGDVSALRSMLGADPALARAYAIDDRNIGRSLLHVATDWPGHFPNVARTIEALLEAGADPNAAVQGKEEAHAERPLHWAASSDDVAALDALLDGGADIEAPGAIFTGGPPMSDAVIFTQWKAARRLLERGAKTTIWQSAALGLTERLEEALDLGPTSRDITNALWNACRGGQLEAAKLLGARGADVNWVGWDRKTPLDVAKESGAQPLIAWLEDQGAKPASQLQ